MPALGGLYKKMPWTAIDMLVGTLAISGVPFFSGFYSKDAILAAAMARVQEDPEHFLLFLLPAVGAVLTAFYMFRMWFLVFAGEPRGFPTAADEVYAHATDEEHALITAMPTVTTMPMTMARPPMATGRLGHGDHAGPRPSS